MKRENSLKVDFVIALDAPPNNIGSQYMIGSLIQIIAGEFKGHVARVVAGPTAAGQLTVKLVGESRRRDVWQYDVRNLYKGEAC